ncbi:MAG TPA: hypothetical protein VIV60_25920 [Polyangiaceae bacterium]
MSAGWLLLGLLAIAFIGSNVARGRRVPGFGLPSGSEWLLTGIAVGPQLFGLVHQKDLSQFGPVLVAGLGWLSMTVGMRFAVCLRPNLDEEAPAPNRLLGVGALLALATAGLLAWLVYTLLGSFGPFEARTRLGTACWIGFALAGSARQLVDWAKERHGARGPITDNIEASIGGGEIIALSATAPLGVLLFSEATEPRDMMWRAALPLVLGLLLGLITLWLLHFDIPGAETWGVLMGVLLLSVGLALRAGSSVIAAGFVLGWLLGRDARAGHQLRKLTHPTEGAVLLPLLVVAGASLHLSELGRLGWVVGIVVGARFLAKLVLGRIARRAIAKGTTSSIPLGLSLASSGEIACLIALEYTLSTPGQLGQLALACAVAASAFGELYGARGLRRLLVAADELGRDVSTVADKGHSVSPDVSGWL